MTFYYVLIALGLIYAIITAGSYIFDKTVNRNYPDRQSYDDGTGPAACVVLVIIIGLLLTIYIKG